MLYPLSYRGIIRSNYNRLSSRQSPACAAMRRLTCRASRVIRLDPVRSLDRGAARCYTVPVVCNVVVGNVVADNGRCRLRGRVKTRRQK